MPDLLEGLEGEDTASGGTTGGGGKVEINFIEPPNGEWLRVDTLKGFVIFSAWDGVSKYVKVAVEREGGQPTIFTAANGQPYLLDPKNATATPFKGITPSAAEAPGVQWVGGKPYVWSADDKKFVLASGLPEIPQKANRQVLQLGNRWFVYDLDTGETKQIDMPALDKVRRTDVMNTPQGWQLIDLDTGEIIKDYPYKEKPDRLTAWEQRSIDLQERQLALDWKRQTGQEQLGWAQFAASLEGPRQWAKYAKLVGGVEPTPPDWMAQYTGRAPEYEEPSGYESWIPAEGGGLQAPGWVSAPFSPTTGQGMQPYGTQVGGVTYGPTRLNEELGSQRQFQQWRYTEPTGGQVLKTPGLSEQTPQASSWARMTPSQQQQILGWQEYGGESAADYFARISKKWPSWGAPQPTRSALPRWR